jgi:hypothetical protein
MRSFILGFLGVLAGLVAAGFAYSMYGDYRGEAESSAWFVELLPTMQQVEALARQQNSLAGVGSRAGKTNPRFAHIDFFRIEDQGTIIVRGGTDGQMMALVPQLDAGNVKWRCIGGSSHAVLPACRRDGELVGPFSP